MYIMYFFFRIIAAHIIIYRVRLQTFSRGLYGDLVCICVCVYCVALCLFYATFPVFKWYRYLPTNLRSTTKKNIIFTCRFVKHVFLVSSLPPSPPTVVHPFAFSATCWFIANTMTTRHYITYYTAPMQQVTESDMLTSHNNFLCIPLPHPYGRCP